MAGHGPIFDPINYATVGRGVYLGRHHNYGTVPSMEGDAIRNFPAARMIQVIAVRHVIGDGTEKEPYRGITSYYSLDGELLAEESRVVVDGAR